MLFEYEFCEGTYPLSGLQEVSIHRSPTMRKTTIPALTRLLFPVKDFDLFSHSLPLVEFISRTMEKKLERLDLLHVIGGSFLSTHLNNIDFRAGRVLSSELMQRLRTQHYENFVSPLLDKVQNLLFEKEGGLQAKVRVEDGDPVKRIISICEQERVYNPHSCPQKKERAG